MPSAPIPTPTITLRFMIDPGAGTCLWRVAAADGGPGAGLGYDLDHLALPLSRNTQAALSAVVALADLSLDWDAPPAPGPHWSGLAHQQLQALAQAALAATRAELAPLGYQIVDDFRAPAPASATRP